MGYDPSNEQANRYYATGFFSNIGARNPTADSTAVSSGMSAAACPGTGNAVMGNSANTNTVADATYFFAGKGMGSNVIQAIPTGNLALMNGNCAAGTGNVSQPTGGNCVGTQAME